MFSDLRAPTSGTKSDISIDAALLSETVAPNFSWEDISGLRNCVNPISPVSYGILRSGPPAAMAPELPGGLRFLQNGLQTARLSRVGRRIGPICPTDKQGIRGSCSVPAAQTIPHAVTANVCAGQGAAARVSTPWRGSSLILTPFFFPAIVARSFFSRAGYVGSIRLCGAALAFAPFPRSTFFQQMQQIIRQW